jgi:hypothetical protein
MRLMQRNISGVADFLEYAENHNLSMADIVKGWAVDITAAPEAGLVSLLAGAVKNPPPAAVTSAHGPVLVPAPEKDETEPDWLFGDEA